MSGARRPRTTAIVSIVILAAAAIVLLLPMLVVGIIEAHSSPHSLTWAAQFSEQVRAGTLYPRWLSGSFHGLGAPTFYFYAPLPFWIDAFVSIVSFDALPVASRLAVSSLLILFASGLAMQSWLWRETSSRIGSLIGAMAYMAAPYHMLDHYVRGAFAEYSAYAVLPLVMLSIRLLADRKPTGPIFLAVSYAALVMTHLPTALLASVLVLPVYVLFRAWRASECRAALALILRAIAAGVLGIGLAAAYLVPALSLQEWISSHLFWGPRYRAENWSLLRPDRWVDDGAHFIMLFIDSLMQSAALIAASLLAALPLIASGEGRRWEVVFWAAMTLITVALVAGLTPWFWSLPWVGKVQFPWRLTLVVEFAVITGLAIAFTRMPKSSHGSRHVFVAIDAVLLAGAAWTLAPGVTMLARDAMARIAFTASHLPLWRLEANEYLPRGFGVSDNQGRLTEAPILEQPLIACAPAATVCQADDEGSGTMRIVVETGADTTVVLRRFGFPGWRIGPHPAGITDDERRLVSFVAPAGRTEAWLHRVMLPEEIWGTAVSGVSLAVLGVVAAGAVRRRRRPHTSISA